MNLIIVIKIVVIWTLREEYFGMIVQNKITCLYKGYIHITSDNAEIHC